MEEDKLNENKEKMNAGGTLLGWLQQVATLITKNGLKGTFTALVVLVLVIMVGSAMLNPAPIMERIEKISETKHTEAVNLRMENDKIIQDAIKTMRMDLSADRILVFETHNGGTSLSNLPFLYVDMTYEEYKRGLYPLADEYKNLRLSRYPFFMSLYKNVYWFGPVEEMEDRDPSLYFRMKEDGDKYIGFMITYGQDVVSGCVCVVYNDSTDVPREQIRSTMYKYGSMIGPLLNKDGI